MKRQFWVRAASLVIHIGRLPVGIITAIPVFLLIVLHTDASWTLAAIQSLPICWATMAGFALNDLFDREKDRSAGANKPLALGKVTALEVKVLAFSLIGCTVAVAVMLARGHSAFIIAATLIGVSAYSWWAQKVPVLKGVATALLCCAPFAYGVELANVHFPMAFYGFLFVFITGRELLLDVKDFNGDQKAGIHTLVFYLRPEISRVLGWSLMVASVVFVCLQTVGVGKILFLITLGSLGLCLAIYVQNERKGLAYSRLTLLAGVIGAALSV
jgi:4-hydroxybenzoate polyprenyltransferase